MRGTPVVRVVDAARAVEVGHGKVTQPLPGDDGPAAGVSARRMRPGRSGPDLRECRNPAVADQRKVNDKLPDQVTVRDI